MSKILVVEDQDEIRELIQRRLQRKRFEVVTAANGADAVRAARKEMPALVIMDLDLPVMDGWEATKRIKGDPATAGIPVLALTAHTTSGDRDAEYEAGADAFLTKPIDFDHLFARIDELLKGPGK